MVKVNLKTNLSFFLVLIGVIILAFIEGVSMSRFFITPSNIIQGSEIQLIAFILITIFIIIVSTLKPYKLVLVAYSSMTLGLIVIITSLFDPSNQTPYTIKMVEVVIGLILIIAGFSMGRGLVVTEKDERMIKEGIKSYKKL